MVYTIVVHLYAKDSPTDIEKLKNKLVEASQVYSKDRETVGWHVMQDHQDPRAFTIVERYERESVSSPLVNVSIDFFVRGLIDADIDAFHRARSIILRYVEERLKICCTRACNQAKFIVWSENFWLRLPNSQITTDNCDRTPTGRLSTLMLCRCWRSQWICAGSTSSTRALQLQEITDMRHLTQIPQYHICMTAPLRPNPSNSVKERMQLWQFSCKYPGSGGL